MGYGLALFFFFFLKGVVITLHVAYCSASVDLSHFLSQNSIEDFHHLEMGRSLSRNTNICHG